jgi:hypothetical protein
MTGGHMPVICIHSLNSTASPPPLRFFHHPHFPYLLEHSYPGIRAADDRHGLWFSPNSKLKRISTKSKCWTSSSNQINDKLLVRKQRGRRRIQRSNWVQWSDMYSHYRISLSSCPIFTFSFCGGIGVWTHGFAFAKQVLYLSHTAVHFTPATLEMGSQELFAPLDSDQNHPHFSLTSN